MDTQDEGTDESNRETPSSNAQNQGSPPANPPEVDDSPLAALPAGQRNAILRAEIIKTPEILEDPRIRVALQMKSHQGPLPPPEDFAAYEQALPGAADRIMRMAEKSLEARIHQQEVIGDCDKSRIRNDFVEAIIGQVFGLIVCIGLGIGGYELIQAGHDAAGGAFIGVPAVALVGHFIFGRIKAKNAAAKGDDE